MPKQPLSIDRPSRRRVLRGWALLPWVGSWVAAPGLAQAQSAAAVDPSLLAADCVIPARAGGGFALTCALARDALQAVRPQRPPLGQRYLPGGIGAVAFDRVASGQLGGSHTLVAFSSGSLLNLAQGRFGPHAPTAVHWLVTLGTDYGVVAVHRDAPWKTLQELLAALRHDVSRVVFGAGGTVGSQDWVKTALLVRAAVRDHKAMRFVAFEGGGEALEALQGKHVQVCCGDAAEVHQRIRGGAPIRLLAVFAPQRLPGDWAAVPTAREQGVELVWPTVRGLYLSANVSAEVAQAWTRAFQEAVTVPGYARLQARYGLFPLELTGKPLQNHVENQLQSFRQLADELGLRRWAR